MNFVWFCFFVKFSPYWNAFPEFGSDQPLIAQCRGTGVLLKEVRIWE
jgi:hypothetical protein